MYMLTWPEKPIPITQLVSAVLFRGRYHGAHTLIGASFVERKPPPGEPLPTEFLAKTCRGLISRTYQHAASNDPTCQYQIETPGSAASETVATSAARSAFDQAARYTKRQSGPLRMTIYGSYLDAWTASGAGKRAYPLFIGSAADTAEIRSHFGVEPDGTGLKDGTLMPGPDGSICGRKGDPDVNAGEEEKGGTL